MAHVLASCSDDPEDGSAVAPLVEFSGSTMGTTWSLCATGAGERHRLLIQTHLDEREAVFSHWREDSALSRFNRQTSTAWFAVPAELARVVSEARDIARKTGDVLDITCAPLVDAWGFGGTRGAGPPDKPELAGAMSHCGWRHLSWRMEPPALRKALPGLRINVASVAEGFVMDELITRLKSEGLRSFMLEIGGEVAGIGTAPDGEPWNIGVRGPGAEYGGIFQTLRLKDQCAATSGTYRHFKAGNPSVNHLLDPRTGRPVDHSLASVTVIHESACQADGFATALMILGPKEGRLAAARLALNAVWIEAE